MTPKERFLLTPEAEQHQKIAHSSVLASALDFALLEMLERMPKEPLLPQSPLAEANYHRIEGARTFRALLETIADKPKALSPTKQPFPYETK